MSEYRKHNPSLFGNQNATRKLTAEDVGLIRKCHAEKNRQIKELNEAYSAKAMAVKFGVHQRTIEKALRYETWRHVGD